MKKIIKIILIVIIVVIGVAVMQWLLASGIGRKTGFGVKENGKGYSIFVSLDKNPAYNKEKYVPEKGYKFVVVKVVLRAKKTVWEYGIDDFKIQIDNRSYAPYLSIVTPALKKHGKLKPGEEAEGYITFEIPEDAKKLTVVYQSSEENGSFGETSAKEVTDP